MVNKTLLHAATLGSAIVMFGCGATWLAQDVGQKTAESLSVAAYGRVAPRLAALNPGDRMQSKFEWDDFDTKRQGRARFVAVADGWAAPFSGGFPTGSLFGFGKITGRTAEGLLGEHLFGYLVGGATLVPRYVVSTQATVIPEEEYKRLASEKARNIGFTDAPLERAATLIFFKDAVVKEVRPLAFTDTPVKDRGAPGPTLGDDLRWYASAERFKVAESKLKSLPPGMDYWEALAALGMVFVTLDSGLTYKVWLADGHLGDPRSVLTAAGFFKVLRFGYLEGSNEVPQLALIFKNNRVHKLVPHGRPEELMGHFD